jgi:ABC-type uncharacterized transport system ATPase component
LELLDKIEKLPKGMDTPITKEYLPDGVNFSGGERQKLSIARADFKNAPIMILDEPTSALDPIAEKKLYDKIYTMMDRKTMLMISHRLQEGFKAFGRQAHGFLTNEAVLIAVETRTSSPIRIVRDHETLQHIRIRGLFPCGEGAGYAGGIVSAGVDGERCAEMVAAYLQK